MSQPSSRRARRSSQWASRPVEELDGPINEPAFQLHGPVNGACARSWAEPPCACAKDIVDRHTDRQTYTHFGDATQD